MSEMRCPGVPHRGHTNSAYPCPLEQAQPVKCEECGNEVELKPGTNGLRQHRFRRGKESSRWCPGGGKTLLGRTPSMQLNSGDMHEPRPYTGELDWSDLVHPYVD